MTFDEACELARIVNGNRRFCVLAVSRFELMAELQAAYRTGTESGFEWVVSVMAVEDVSYVGRMRSEQDWREFAACAPRPSDQPKQVGTKPQLAASVKDNQLPLF